MSEAAEADDIHDHVAVKALAEFHSKTRRVGHCFRVVTIHMKDRRLNQFCRIRTVSHRTLIARVRRCEADLIVNDDMHRAARAVTAGIG